MNNISSELILNKANPNLKDKSSESPKGAMKRNVEIGVPDDMSMLSPFQINDMVKCFSVHLFGRGSESYTGPTKQLNLRDMLALAICDKFVFGIVFAYIKGLASFYQNNFQLYHQECFKIQDPEDGIKTLMIKGTDDKNPYRMELWTTFQNTFVDYLNNNVLHDGLYNEIIINVLKSFSIVLRTKATNGFLDSLLLSLYKKLSEETTIWGEETHLILKNHTLLMLFKLIDTNCFADLHSTHPTLIEIIKKIEDLLSSDQWQLVNNAITALGRLANAGLLNGASSQMIERIFVKKGELLSHEQDAVASNAITVIEVFGKAGLLREISPKAIEAIITQTEARLSHDEWRVVQNALMFIYVFGEMGLLKNVSSNVVEEIRIKLKKLLDHDDGLVVLNAIRVMLSMEEINQKSLLDSITRVQVEIIHQKILETPYETITKELQENYMRIMTFLAQHSSGAIREMCFEMIEHINSAQDLLNDA